MHTSFLECHLALAHPMGVPVAHQLVVVGAEVSAARVLLYWLLDPNLLVAHELAVREAVVLAVREVEAA